MGGCFVYLLAFLLATFVTFSGQSGTRSSTESTVVCTAPSCQPHCHPHLGSPSLRCCCPSAASLGSPWEVRRNCRASLMRCPRASHGALGRGLLQPLTVCLSPALFQPTDVNFFGARESSPGITQEQPIWASVLSAGKHSAVERLFKYRGYGKAMLRDSWETEGICWDAHDSVRVSELQATHGRRHRDCKQTQHRDVLCQSTLRAAPAPLTGHCMEGRGWHSLLCPTLIGRADGTHRKVMLLLPLHLGRRTPARSAGISVCL